MRRHLLCNRDLSRDDIERLLGRAESFSAALRDARSRSSRHCGPHVVNLFYETSTRTRSLVRARRQAALRRSVSDQASGSSVDKGESLRDTVQTLSAYKPGGDRDARSPQVGAAGSMARAGPTPRSSTPAMASTKHPTPALLDASHARAAARRRSTACDIWIVGDVLHSGWPARTSWRSRAWAARSPSAARQTLIPRGIESLGCRVRTTLDGSSEADVRLRPAHAARAHDGLVRSLAARVRARSTRSTAGGSDRTSC